MRAELKVSTVILLAVFLVFIVQFGSGIVFSQSYNTLSVEDNFGNTDNFLAGTKVTIQCFGKIEVYKEGELKKSETGMLEYIPQESGKYLIKCGYETKVISVRAMNFPVKEIIPTSIPNKEIIPANIPDKEPFYQNEKIIETTKLIKTNNKIITVKKNSFSLNENHKFKINKLEIYSKNIAPISYIETLDGKKLNLIPIIIEIDEEYEIELPVERAIQPGVYNLIIETEEGINEIQFSWGLVSVNTKKSLYHPNETAEILVVVLDKEGYLVSNAEINLNITNPDNETQTFLTSENAIIEIEKGIYQANYIAGKEGNYTLSVTAKTNVLVSMESYFTVKNYYEFDILRNIPSTIDPQSGPFKSELKIISYTNSTAFNFREYLPKEFEITNTNANILIDDNAKILEWNNLTNNSLVSYSVQTPLIHPYLYEIGPAEIDYFNKIFIEARPWYLAVDPVESLWSESNSVSSGLSLTSSSNADGSGTGTWADASGKWTKATYEWWEFTMANLTQTGDINNVTLHLRHYQSLWADDNYLIQIYNGSTWINVQSYTNGSGPPTQDTNDSWDVKSLGLDTIAEVNAAKIRIIGNGVSGGEDTVNWFVDWVELRVNISTTPPAIIANATSPSLLYTNTDWLINLTITDPNLGNTLTGYVQFYINDSKVGSVHSQTVDNNTNTLIATLGSGNFSKWDNLTVEVWASDGTENITKSNLTVVIISNSPPTTVNPTLDPITVYKTTSQVTCNNGTVSDADGDSINWHYQWYVNDIEGVTTQSISNISYNKDDVLICEIWAADGEDNSTKYNSSSVTISNSLPAVTEPTLNNTTPLTDDILSCDGGIFSDGDGDSESARYYRWYDSDVLMSGQTTNTLDLSVSNLDKGDTIICSIAVNDGEDNSTWINSSNTATIQNSAPSIQIQNIFVNCSAGHCFDVTAGVVDLDGFSDITATNISSTSGTCINIANSTSENYFNSTWNCSGIAFQSTTIIIGFTDASSSYIQTTQTINSYPNKIPEITTVELTPDSPTQNNDLTCAVLGWNDEDGDSQNYYYEWYKNGNLNLTIPSDQTTNILSSGNTTNGETWNCTVIPYDGYENGTSLTDSVLVENNPPNKPTLNLPSDGAANQEISVILNVTVTDPNGDAMNVTFWDNSTGQQINITQTGIANGGYATVMWSGLSYTTIYYWYANSTDGEYENKSDIWNFTTGSDLVAFSVSLNSPQNQIPTNDNTTDFNFTVSGNKNFYNCTLYLNDTNKGNNDSVSNDISTIITSTELDDGFYEWYVNCTVNGVTNQSEIRELTIDTTPPNCILVSITPNDIEANSTGLFEVIINCTDESGINQSRYLITRTLEGMTPPGLPNLWSIRPPVNDHAQNYSSAEYNISQILLADSRGMGKWYDSEIFTNNYDYAVSAYKGPLVNPYLSLANGTTWASLNLSWNIEPVAFRSTLFLSRGYMETELKKDYELYKDNSLLIKYWNLEVMRGTQNYTICGFRNIQYSGAPNKDLLTYYCNSSYNVSDGLQPPLSSNCVSIASFSTTDLDYIYYTSRNSSYGGGSCYSITNGLWDGIIATDTYYIYYISTVLAVKGIYLVRYANGTSGTNVSFADSEVAWTTVDNGVNYNQAQFTPDIWFSTVKNGDQFQLGFYVEDKAGNNLTNFTFYTDDIGDVSYPITSPNIGWYNSSVTGLDMNLNGTHGEVMIIRVNTAKDADAVGSVNHSLYLCNPDGSINFTINNSFYSNDDSDMSMDFNTSLVPDGIYKINVTAIADDNLNDIESHLTHENFTIDNTNPFISFNPNTDTNNTYGRDWIFINITASDANKDAVLLYWNGTPEIFDNNDGNFYWKNKTSLSEDTYVFYAWINDTVNHINQTENRQITIDISGPIITLITPVNNSGDNDGNIIFEYNVTDATNITNCTLIFQGGSNQTNETVVRNQTQSFYINNLIECGYNWSILCYDDVSNQGNSLTKYFDVVLTTDFGGETTDLSQVNDTSDIENFTVENPDDGKIEYIQNINLSGGVNLNNLITISNNFISVDVVTEQRLNKSARLFFYNLTYEQTPIILRDNEICSDCKIESYQQGNLTFNITHFTNYTSGANSNLTIWDETDPEGGNLVKSAGEQITFFANYTNRTSGESINSTGLVYCEIQFFDSTDNMTFNETSSLYEYNRSFGSSGIYDWNVTCNGSSLSYEILNTSDDVEVGSSSLEVYLMLPLSIPGEGDAENGGEYKVGQNKVFILKANVTCRGGDCGDVNGTVRYNLSSSEWKPVNATSDTPFYVVNSSNGSAQNPVSCGILNENDSCVLNWTINSTGDLNSIWEFDVMFNTSTTGNITNSTKIEITKILIMSISFTEINFGVVTPATIGDQNPALNNSNYSILAHSNSNSIDNLWIKGTDLEPQDNPGYGLITYEIGIGNITWYNESNFSLSQSITPDYQLIDSDLSSGENKSMFFWINVPGGLEAQEYRGSLYFLGNSTT